MNFLLKVYELLHGDSILIFSVINHKDISLVDITQLIGGII